MSTFIKLPGPEKPVLWSLQKCIKEYVQNWKADKRNKDSDILNKVYYTSLHITQPDSTPIRSGDLFTSVVRESFTNNKHLAAKQIVSFRAKHIRTQKGMASVFVYELDDAQQFDAWRNLPETLDEYLLSSDSTYRKERISTHHVLDPIWRGLQSTKGLLLSTTSSKVRVPEVRTDVLMRIYDPSIFFFLPSGSLGTIGEVFALRPFVPLMATVAMELQLEKGPLGNVEGLHLFEAISSLVSPLRNVTVIADTGNDDTTQQICLFDIEQSNKSIYFDQSSKHAAFVPGSDIYVVLVTDDPEISVTINLSEDGKERLDRRAGTGTGGNVLDLASPTVHISGMIMATVKRLFFQYTSKSSKPFRLYLFHAASTLMQQKECLQAISAYHHAIGNLYTQQRNETVQKSRNTSLGTALKKEKKKNTTIPVSGPNGSPRTSIGEKNTTIPVSGPNGPPATKLVDKSVEEFLEQALSSFMFLLDAAHAALPQSPVSTPEPQKALQESESPSRTSLDVSQDDSGDYSQEVSQDVQDFVRRTEGVPFDADEWSEERTDILERDDQEEFVRKNSASSLAGPGDFASLQIFDPFDAVHVDAELDAYYIQQWEAKNAYDSYKNETASSDEEDDDDVPAFVPGRTATLRPRITYPYFNHPIIIHLQSLMDDEPLQNVYILGELLKKLEMCVMPPYDPSTMFQEEFIGRLESDMSLYLDCWISFLIDTRRPKVRLATKFAENFRDHRRVYANEERLFDQIGLSFYKFWDNFLGTALDQPSTKGAFSQMLRGKSYEMQLRQNNATVHNPKFMELPPNAPSEFSSNGWTLELALDIVYRILISGKVNNL